MKPIKISNFMILHEEIPVKYWVIKMIDINLLLMLLLGSEQTQWHAFSSRKAEEQVGSSEPPGVKVVQF